jgi:hypothetical protein
MGAVGWSILGGIVVVAALILMGRWMYRSSQRVPGEPEVVPQPLREVEPVPDAGAEPGDDVYAPAGTADDEAQREPE